MKRLIFCLFCFIYLQAYSMTQPDKCAHWGPLLKSICQRMHTIWTEGSTELYISGYAWHNRYTYRPEKIQSYNEAAWGGGLGKGLFDADGDWQGLYAFAFLDSHRHIEPVAGYAFLKLAHFDKNLKAGLGYSILVTSRVDIFNGIPFPGILPWASLIYKKAAIAATYIPGSAGAGNVLYLVAKYTF